MSNGMTVYVPTIEELESVEKMAIVAASSDVFDIKLSKKPDKMKMLMLTGMSLGINPILAPNYVYEFNGKFGLLTKTMIGLVQNSGKLHSMDSGYIEDNKGNKIGRWFAMSRVNPNGGEPFYHREEFTIQDAKDAGIYNKDNWNYPLRMCLWRSISWVCSVLFSDVIGGMQSTEEIGMIHDNQGVPIIQSSRIAISDEVDINAEFQRLVIDHGPQIVFPACRNGKPPQTEEDLETLKDYLSKLTTKEEE